MLLLQLETTAPLAHIPGSMLASDGYWPQKNETPQKKQGLAHSPEETGTSSWHDHTEASSIFSGHWSWWARYYMKKNRCINIYTTSSELSLGHWCKCFSSLIWKYTMGEQLENFLKSKINQNRFVFETNLTMAYLLLSTELILSRSRTAAV